MRFRDDVVSDAIKIEFSQNIPKVHFVKLLLKDTKGKVVADAFYWGSNDKYKGAWTLTGPTVSRFEDINKLLKVNLEMITRQHILILDGWNA